MKLFIQIMILIYNYLLDVTIVNSSRSISSFENQGVPLSIRVGRIDSRGGVLIFAQEQFCGPTKQYGHLESVQSTALEQYSPHPTPLGPVRISTYLE